MPAAPPSEIADADHTLSVPAALAGMRLDQALGALLAQHSRTRLKGWIEAGLVRVDGIVATEVRRKMRGGEVVAVVEPAPAPHAGVVAAENIALRIVHEDAALLVVDKPAGLVVHPGNGNRAGTLQNALLHHEPALAALPRSGIVHRLDKDTSGLLVVARTPEAQTDLVRQLAARTVKREYGAIVHGDLARPTTIDAPIGRHPTQRTTMAVVERGRPARTQVEVIERLGMATLVRCRLETGRTHQIRVHLTAIGHPLVGDPTYRGRRAPATNFPEAARAFARQALHAQRLGLVHPLTRENIEWEAPIPADFAQLLVALRTAVAEKRG